MHHEQKVQPLDIASFEQECQLAWTSFFEMMLHPTEKEKTKLLEKTNKPHEEKEH